MAKLSKEEIAKREGMAYALRIAKEKGIDELEKDLQMRNCHNIPVGLSQKQLNDFSQTVKQKMVRYMIILIAVTLHDEFEFGQKRVQKFIDRFMLKCGCLDEDYTTWEEQIEILREELGIELDVKEN